MVVLAALLGIGIFYFSQKQPLLKPPTTTYVFDKSKFCPDHGNCEDYGFVSRQCDKRGDCMASCHYGCVSREWMKGRADCEAIWSNFECECIESVCQRK